MRRTSRTGTSANLLATATPRGLRLRLTLATALLSAEYVEESVWQFMIYFQSDERNYEGTPLACMLVCAASAGWAEAFMLFYALHG